MERGLSRKTNAAENERKLEATRRTGQKRMRCEAKNDGGGISVQDNTALEKEEDQDLGTLHDTGSGSTQPTRQQHRGDTPAGDDPDEAHLRVLFREGMVASGMRLSRTSLGESICSIEDVFVAAKRVLLPGDGASCFNAKRGYVIFAQFPGRVHRLEYLNCKRVNLLELSAVTFTDY